METRDRSRPRSRRDSVQRRRLEAKSVAPLRPTAGSFGTYSYVRGTVPSPRSRIARGSEAFSPLDEGWTSETSGEIETAAALPPAEPRRAEKLIVLAAEPDRVRSPWLLVVLALVAAAIMIGLALVIR